MPGFRQIPDEARESKPCIQRVATRMDFTRPDPSIAWEKLQKNRVHPVAMDSPSQTEKNGETCPTDCLKCGGFIEFIHMMEPANPSADSSVEYSMHIQRCTAGSPQMLNEKVPSNRHIGRQDWIFTKSWEEMNHKC